MIWRSLYNALAVPIMTGSMLLAGMFSKKVQRGIRGRLGEGERLREARARCRDDRPRVLVHCASAGELEGAVPLMQALVDQSDVDIILSYFSPSAVERAMKIEVPVDHIYLPVDSKPRMTRMLETIEPSLIVFVKHDIWPNLVWLAKDRNIPTALVNGNFRPDSKRLKRFAIPFGRSVLPQLSAIYAVAPDDARRFRFLAGNGTEIEAAGDTRFDRVRQRALDGRRDQGPLAERLAGRPVIVAGSTWHADEKLLLPAWRGVKDEIDDAVLVLVPHEPSSERVQQIRQNSQQAGLQAATLDELEGGAEMPDVIVVDRVGVLAGLYGLGKAAYVGGAFGAGVHSVIEPAVFGVPVLFGPRYLMSHEARDLLALGAALSVEEPDVIRDAFLDALRDGETSAERGRMAAEFVRERSGVAERIATHLAQLARF